MSTELARIQREANLRAQKKKILQRLKYSSPTVGITGDSVASGVDNNSFLFAQEKRSDLRGFHHIANEENTPVACQEKVDERLISRLAAVDKNYVEVNKLQQSKIPRYVLGKTSLVSPRRERQFYEEVTEIPSPDNEGTKRDRMKISIDVDTAESKQYTPSFLSAVSEYHRKKAEIKKKADERRRNVVTPSFRNSSAFDMCLNDEDYLNVYDIQPRRSVSLTELGYRPHDTLDGKRVSTSDSSTNENDRNGEHSPIPRSSSWFSLYESFSKRERDEINFKWFARKQQEELEDNLRRVEQNLDTTFSKLRKYVNAGTALRSTKNSGQS